MGKTDSILSLACGAAIGAAAMYLLDPEEGDKRRTRLASAAGDQFDTAREKTQEWAALAAKHGADWADKAASVGRDVADRARAHAHSVLDQANDYASRGGQNVSDQAQDYVDRVRAYVDQAHQAAMDGGKSTQKSYSGAIDQAGDALSGLSWSNIKSRVLGLASQAGSSARDTSGDLADSARRKAARAARQTASYLAPEDDRSVVGPVTASALGAAAAGIGLMYFLDPERGRSRRAWIGQKTYSAWTSTGKTFRRTGKHWRNRLQGKAAQARTAYQNISPFPQEAVSSDDLVSRVRASLTGAATYPDRVQVMADNEGRITLSGTLSSHERTRVLSNVSAVKGVKEIINRFAIDDNGGTDAAATPASSAGSGI